MEEVLDKLESAAIGSSNLTEFDHLYKNWGRFGNQEERRKELLENQKSKRSNKLDRSRGILELVNAAEENVKFNRDSQKKVYYRPSVYVAGFNKVSPGYKNVLMMSEWIIERPEDLNENWYVSPCPCGVRMLVVAHQGTTKCYTKYGMFKFGTRSVLPGSTRSDYYGEKKSPTCTVLDCFYHETKNTMYVIDFLAWNNLPMSDCETEFRHFWLQSQFAERQELGTISENNKIKFILLPKVLCTPDNLNEFMMTWPHFQNNFPKLDGFLFYHKHAHYVSGRTPLVGWLYPYMVQEVLGADITMNPASLAEKPKDYIDQATFIKQFEEKEAKKQKKHHPRNNNRMDTSDVDKPQTQSKVMCDMDAEIENLRKEALVMEAEETPQTKAIVKTKHL